MELATFLCEVDLGTLDRLCSLLQPAMGPSRPGGYPSEESVVRRRGGGRPTRAGGSFSLPAEVVFSFCSPCWCQPGFPPAAQWQANVQMVAPKGSLLLQFPVPDLRVWAERRAWAEKAVRMERLRLDLAGVELRTDLEPTGPTQLELTLTDLHGK